VPKILHLAVIFVVETMKDVAHSQIQMEHSLMDAVRKVMVLNVAVGQPTLMDLDSNQNVVMRQPKVAVMKVATKD